MFLTPTLWVLLQDPARRIPVRHASSRPVVVTHPDLRYILVVECRIGPFVGYPDEIPLYALYLDRTIYIYDGFVYFICCVSCVNVLNELGLAL